MNYGMRPTTLGGATSLLMWGILVFWREYLPHFQVIALVVIIIWRSLGWSWGRHPSSQHRQLSLLFLFFVVWAFCFFVVFSFLFKITNIYNQDELEEDILLHSIAGHLQFMVSILQSSPMIQVSTTVVGDHNKNKDKTKLNPDNRNSNSFF